MDCFIISSTSGGYRSPCFAMWLSQPWLKSTSPYMPPANALIISYLELQERTYTGDCSLPSHLIISNSIFKTCSKIQHITKYENLFSLQYVTLYDYQYFRPLPVYLFSGVLGPYLYIPLPVDLLCWSTETISIHFQPLPCGPFLLVNWDKIYTLIPFCR